MSEKIQDFDSSNVSEIEFFPEDQKALITFKDGSVYEYAPVTNAMIGGLRVAGSKGSYIHHSLPRGRKVKGSRKEESELPTDPRLQSYEPDECCGNPIWRALRAGELDKAESWTCPKCGCEWKPDEEGPLRHWRPRPVLIVIR